MIRIIGRGRLSGVRRDTSGNMNNDSKAIEDLEDEISRLEKTNAKERLLRLNDKKYVSHKLKSESNTVKIVRLLVFLER